MFNLRRRQQANHSFKNARITRSLTYLTDFIIMNIAISGTKYINE